MKKEFFGSVILAGIISLLIATFQEAGTLASSNIPGIALVNGKLVYDKEEFIRNPLYLRELVFNFWRKSYPNLALNQDSLLGIQTDKYRFMIGPTGNIATNEFSNIDDPSLKSVSNNILELRITDLKIELFNKQIRQLPTKTLNRVNNDLALIYAMAGIPFTPLSSTTGVTYGMELDDMYNLNSFRSVLTIAPSYMDPNGVQLDIGGIQIQYLKDIPVDAFGPDNMTGIMVTNYNQEPVFVQDDPSANNKDKIQQAARDLILILANNDLKFLISEQ